jgi:hypothetical protein
VRRLVRAGDRLLLGAFMAVLALVLERRLRKALAKSEPAGPGAEIGE